MKEIKEKNKKATANLVPIIFGIVGVILALVIGFKIVDVLQGTTTPNSTAYNATVELTGDNGLGLVVDLVPVILIIVILVGGVWVYFRYFK